VRRSDGRSPDACCCPLLQARLSKANQAHAKAESNLSAVRTQSQGLANEYDRWVGRRCIIVIFFRLWLHCCCIVGQGLANEDGRWLPGPHCCSRQAALVWVGLLRCEILLHYARAGCWCVKLLPLVAPTLCPGFAIMPRVHCRLLAEHDELKRQLARAGLGAGAGAGVPVSTGMGKKEE
jgi:hypothetical protein